MIQALNQEIDMKRSVSVAVLVLLLPMKAWAGSCGYTHCWGSVGIGPNGVWGFSHSYATEDAAIDRVASECPYCTAFETFYNTCGAIAVGNHGKHGFGWGDSRAIAENQAMGYCRSTTNNCAIKVWACSK